MKETETNDPILARFRQISAEMNAELDNLKRANAKIALASNRLRKETAKIRRK
jgi:hypothetical protein